MKLLARGISEERGLVVVQADVLERRARQEAVLQAANEALYASARPTQPPPGKLSHRLRAARVADCFPMLSVLLRACGCGVWGWVGMCGGVYADGRSVFF